MSVLKDLPCNSGLSYNEWLRRQGWRGWVGLLQLALSPCIHYPRASCSRWPNYMSYGYANVTFNTPAADNAIERDPIFIYTSWIQLHLWFYWKKKKRWTLGEGLSFYPCTSSTPYFCLPLHLPNIFLGGSIFILLLFQAVYMVQLLATCV